MLCNIRLGSARTSDSIVVGFQTRSSFRHTVLRVAFAIYTSVRRSGQRYIVRMGTQIVTLQSIYGSSLVYCRTSSSQATAHDQYDVLCIDWLTVRHEVGQQRSQLRSVAVIAVTARSDRPLATSTACRCGRA